MSLIIMSLCVRLLSSHSNRTIIPISNIFWISSTTRHWNSTIQNINKDNKIISSLDQKLHNHKTKTYLDGILEKSQCIWTKLYWHHWPKEDVTPTNPPPVHHPLSIILVLVHLLVSMQYATTINCSFYIRGEYFGYN